MSMTWQESMLDLLEFLEKAAAERRNVALARNFFTGATIQITEIVFGKVDPVTSELAQKLDGLLKFANVTEGCKEYLKNMALMHYTIGSTPDMIMSMLNYPNDEVSCGPFMQLDFAAYEFEQLYYKLEIDSNLVHIDVVVHELEFDLLWIEQFLAKYGACPRVEELKNGMVSALTSIKARLIQVSQ